MSKRKLNARRLQKKISYEWVLEDLKKCKSDNPDIKCDGCDCWKNIKYNGEKDR